MVQTNLDFSGDSLKSEGIERVSINNQSWLEKAEHIAMRIAGQNPCFTSESVRFWVEGAGHIGTPKNPNAWGALFNRMSRKGLIVKTGEYTKSHIASCHGRFIPVWRKA